VGSGVGRGEKRTNDGEKEQRILKQRKLAGVQGFRWLSAQKGAIMGLLEGKEIRAGHKKRVIESK